jgi:RNA polymerase sigma-70 factor (ECF subfamily)
MLDGDELAFESFFNAVYPALYRFALARLGSDADAAGDVAQAAICKAITKLHTFRGEAALLTWVCVFCRREIYAHLSRHAERPLVQLGPFGGG